MRKVGDMCPSRVIVDQIDPDKLVPGGIDTCISDLVRFGSTHDFLVVGTTSDPKVPLGIWQTKVFSDRTIDFLPVARVDREKRRRRARVPESVRLLFGCMRFGRRIPRMAEWQGHRVEVGFVLLFFRPRKYIQFIHNDSNGLTGANSDSMWKGLSFIYRFVERRVMRSADGIVVFNKPDGTRLQALRFDTHVARTWFNGDVFFPSDRPDDAKPSVCWVGRLEEQKDPRLAIYVVDKLRLLVPDIRLTIVGDGSLREELEADILARNLRAHVIMRGSVSRMEVAQIMRDSRCLLMTSHYEGSPRVLVEANASGVPVVAPPGGDPDGVLERLVNGQCVESRDPDMLADAVIECLRYESAACVASASEREVKVCVGEILAIGS